jgi:DivIVA domain-containing protein
MELIPKTFRDVQFREKVRGGYHPEDVDEFLEQAAVAAEELQQRLQRAEARAQRAEQALEDSSANDETLKRVLFMAQRTADQAVREAREEAERLVAEARVQGQAIVAEAEERGRRAFDTKVVEARSNLERAEEALRSAQREAEVLRGWVDVNRGQLLAALREATAVIEQAGLVGEQPGEPTLPPKPPVVLSGEQPPEGRGDEGDGATGPGSEVSEVPAPEAPAQASAPAEGRVAATGPRAGERAGGQGENVGGRWDPRFLDNLEGHPSSPGGEEAGEDTQPATLAFDERALDSFFQGKDLSEERGLGRFRRRN